MQVLSPLQTMLANVAQEVDIPVVDAVATGRQPTELRPATHCALGWPPKAGLLHDAPPSMHAEKASGDAAEVGASAHGDAIETLADLQDEGSERALQCRMEVLRGGEAGSVAPCMTAMRARGLRQQRVSRESRRESAVLNLDLAVPQGGAGHGGGVGCARERLGTPGVGGPPGGAGAVLVRQRIQKRVPRVSGETGLHCEVVFGDAPGSGA